MFVLVYKHTFIFTRVLYVLISRYDQEGYAVDSQSLTETRSVGSGGTMNWKTLSDVKNELLGQGEKVQCTHGFLLYIQ